MFNEMDASRKHQEIFKSMAFPDTQRIRQKRENTIVQTTYTCNDTSCDFTSALLDLQKNPRFMKNKMGDICTHIVNDIKEHQDEYLPGAVDGYFINRMGHQLLHLQRQDSKGTDVTGCIEYNDLRKQSMDFYEKKLMNQNTAKKPIDINSCADVKFPNLSCINSLP